MQKVPSMSFLCVKKRECTQEKERRGCICVRIVHLGWGGGQGNLLMHMYV